MVEGGVGWLEGVSLEWGELGGVWLEWGRRRVGLLVFRKVWGRVAKEGRP